MKTLQIISDEALERGKQMSPEEILRFLDEFRKAHAAREFADQQQSTSHDTGET